MGQYWEMIAHERCETLGNWGKAGEFVCSEVPDQIIHLLAVPVEDTGAPPCLSSSNQSHCGDDKSGPAAAHQSPTHSARLLQLPIEVVFLITAQLDLNSLYTLSRCCRILRSLLHAEVHTRFRRTLAPWANTPLMCAGDYDFIPDPEGLEDMDIPQKPYNQMTAYHLMLLQRPINVVASSRTCLYPPTLNPTPHEEPSWAPLGYEPWRRILEIKKYFPPRRQWVLRNLTTMEYVYAGVLTSKHGYGGGPDCPDAQHKWGFTLGTLVVVNTCWSDDPSANMTCLDTRGRWAGDCFDIVEKKRLLQDMKAGGGEWVDVSYNMWWEMVRLYEENRWDIKEDSDECCCRD
ncbi:hypothetical protein BGX38DRAFT_1162836 [Terfezia claveryi]|nr:hypothetical protein BGX38DRAFT_1162836 [Terfezia claveryi]